MELNPTVKINKQYEINKAEIQQVLNKKDTIKTDDTKQNYIKPYLSVALCDSLIYQNVLLKTCLETLAEDIVYNDVNITSIYPNADTTKSDVIKEFWELNQDETQKAILDYCSYGFGALEIVFDEIQEPTTLYEIQADTLYIKKETRVTNTGEKKTVYFAVQQVAGVDKIKMRLFHRLEDYDLESDNELPVCLWIGGGRKSDFYDYPLWISAFNHVSASVSLDMLDAQKLADGNLISGILTIIRPPAPINLTHNQDGSLVQDIPVEDTLEDKMEQKGTGVFTLELTTLNPDIPLDVKYIQISESNYEYLENLSSKSDEKILASVKIPKARLLIDDTTESMNSQKTNTLYKIYTFELNNKQRPLELLMKKFNLIYFDFEGKVEIDTPSFIDDREIETQTITNLFNNGLITLGQAIEKVTSIYPDLKEYQKQEIDLNNPIYWERYYNGNPLGLARESDEEKILNGLGELVDYIQIG